MLPKLNKDVGGLIASHLDDEALANACLTSISFRCTFEQALKKRLLQRVQENNEDAVLVLLKACPEIYNEESSVSDYVNSMCNKYYYNRYSSLMLNKLKEIVALCPDVLLQQHPDGCNFFQNIVLDATREYQWMGGIPEAENNESLKLLECLPTNERGIQVRKKLCTERTSDEIYQKVDIFRKAFLEFSSMILGSVAMVSIFAVLVGAILIPIVGLSGAPISVGIFAVAAVAAVAVAISIPIAVFFAAVRMSCRLKQRDAISGMLDSKESKPTNDVKLNPANESQPLLAKSNNADVDPCYGSDATTTATTSVTAATVVRNGANITDARKAAEVRNYARLFSSVVPNDEASVGSSPSLSMV